MNSAVKTYLPAIIREWLEGRPHIRKAIGNTGWLLFDRILRMVIGVTVGAWVARYLGPAQFGELAYALSFIAFFQVIARLEADGFIVRDIAQDRDKTSLVLGTALRLRLSFAILSWAVAIAFMFVCHPDDHRLLLITAIVGAGLVFQASDTIDLWFQSQSQNSRTVIAKLASYLLSNGLKILLLLLKAPLIAFAAAVSFEGAALALTLVLAYRRFPTEQRWQATLAQARILLNQCWPLIVSGLLITTYVRIDQIMIKEILGEHELGIYAAALPLSQIWLVLPSTLLTSLWPYVSQQKKRGEEAYHEVLVKIFRLFAIVALAGSLLTALAAPWLIDLLYGAQYRPAAVVLGIHVFVNIFVFQSLAQNLWIINNNVRSITILSSMLAAIISVIANYLLLHAFGIRGAAFSILLTECVSAVIPCLLQKDLLILYKRAFLLIKSES